MRDGEQRDRDALQHAGRRVVGGAEIDLFLIHRVGRADRVAAEKRADGQAAPGAFAEGAIELGEFGARWRNAFDQLLDHRGVILEQFLRLHGGVAYARVEGEQARVVEADNIERSVVAVNVFAGFDDLQLPQSDVNQAVHAGGLGGEIRFLECFRILRRTVRIETILDRKRVELWIDTAGVLVDDRGIDAAQAQDRITRVAVGKDDAVGRRESFEIVAALDELVRSLANRRSVFRHGLIKAHGDAAAAVAVENDFAVCSELFLEVINAFGDVERTPI